MRLYQLKKCKRVAGLSYSPDGRQLAVVTSGAEDHVGSVVWLDVLSGEPRRTIPLDVQRCALAPDHVKLAIAYSPYSRPGLAAPVRYAKVPTDGSEPGWVNLRARRDHIFALGWDPYGARLAVADGAQYRRTADLGAYEWEFGLMICPMGSSKVEWQVVLGSSAGVLVFSPDGTQLAVTGGPGSEPRVHLFELPSQKPRRFDPPGTRTRCLTYSPDGTRLAVANARTVYVVDNYDLTDAAMLEGHKGQVNALAFTPNGRRLLSASHDGAIRVWDAVAGRLIQAFDWKVGPVTALALAPDGLTAAAAGKSGQVVIWDLDG
jgi:WD40 repeat protein